MLVEGWIAASDKLSRDISVKFLSRALPMNLLTGTRRLTRLPQPRAVWVEAFGIPAACRYHAAQFGIQVHGADEEVCLPEDVQVARDVVARQRDVRQGV